VLVEIVVPAPAFLLWVVIGLDVVAISSVVLKKGPLARRLLGVGAVAAVSVLLLVFLYRPSRLAVTSDALVDRTYGRAMTTPWSEVRRAFVVKGFAQGEYRPTSRTNGSALPNLRAGWFKLSNGRTARVFAQASADALVLETERTLYLLAPDRLAELIAAMREHVAISE
jgi:hypothetical protein